MFKKLILVFAVLALVFASCSYQSENQSDVLSEYSRIEISHQSENSAQSEIEEIIESSTPEKEFPLGENSFENGLNLGVYKADDLTAYYTKNAEKSVYPASLTKMVTASVALKYCKVDKVFPVGTELSLVQPHSSLCGLRQGMSLSLEHLLYGLLLPSGNDAAYTIAVNVARSFKGNENLSDEDAVEYFCGLMNDYCQEIGAVNSHFTTPEGWDDENQYTTVNDLAVIASKALESNIILQIVSTAEKRMLVNSGETFNLVNSNRFLHQDSEFYDADVIGIKTGTTDNAGACLVACAQIDGEKYILIATGCSDDSTRFNTVTQLVTALRSYVFAA